MLKLIEIEKTFSKGTVNEHHALRGINLHLEEGEFVTIVGSNGAGKSTLFNAISGSFYCDHGRIVLDQKDITYQRDFKRARSISRIFQDPMKGTAPDLTIAENVALSYARSKHRLMSFALNRKNYDYFQDLLSRLNMGLEDRMNTKMGLLSGGQRQAVTLLMATIGSPKLLLLDEHTAALDPVAAERVLDITRQIVKEKNITTLMITHNISSALHMGNRTIMMEQGRIVKDLRGPQREGMDVAGLMALYRQECGKLLDDDRMLLTKE